MSDDPLNRGQMKTNLIRLAKRKVLLGSQIFICASSHIIETAIST
jgi:hypothetical protein